MATQDSRDTVDTGLASAPLPLVSMDDGGRITGWNDAATGLFGRTSSQVVGRPLTQTLIPPAYRVDHHAGFEHYLRTGEGPLIGSWVGVEAEHAEGHPIAVEMLVWSSGDPASQQRTHHAVFREAVPHPDGSALLRAQTRRLESQNAFLDAVLRHQSDAVVACDAEGQLTVFNDAARQLHGRGASRVGAEEWATAYRLHQPDGRPMSPEEVPLARALRGERIAEVPMKVGDPSRPETMRDLLATGQQLSTSDGRLLGAMVTMRDVTESLVAEHRLRRAAEVLAGRNAELEVANRFKVDLIGMLGHEVRTPLTSITGYAEVLADVLADDPAAAAHVRVIRRNARRLDTVVRNVLAMVAAGAGRLAANRAVTPVRGLLEDALEGALEGDPGRSAEIDCDAETAVYADRSHVDQILTNLVSNAAKYGDGVARLAARRSGETVRIEVRDNGHGVPVELLGDLFDRFTRAEAMADKVNGSGLGLHIARELARANGGDLWHEPTPEHPGATFVLTLPSA